MANRKNTRRALLMSIISLMLCCSMLIGTTFAWFTDEVVSGTNQILAGNLDVELYHSDKAVRNEKVTTTTKLFDDVTPDLWEPGAVAYEVLTVANEGTLAMKYNLAVLFENATVVNGKTLADALKVAVVDADELTSREAAIAAGAGLWQDFASFNLTGTLEAGKTATYGVVIYWEPTDNDNIFNMNNENKGKTLSIDLGVKLLATQLDFEEDSFGSDYDENLMIAVSSFEELKQAIADVNKGGVIYLNPGVYNFGYVLTIAGKECTIEGIGNVKLVNNGSSHFFNVTEESNVVFKNLELDGNFTNNAKSRNGIFVRYNSTVTLDDCNVYGAGHFSVCIDQISDKEANEGKTATVKLINGTKVETVDSIAYPTSGHSYDGICENSYVKVTTDATSTIDSFTKNDQVAKPENITLNGIANVPTADQLQDAIDNAVAGEVIA